MYISLRKIICTLTLLTLPLAATANNSVSNSDSNSMATSLSIEVGLKQFNALTEKPYLALWYSLPNSQYTPLKVLRSDSKWLRDLKSFWRYIARYHREKLDGITAATVKPGQHEFQFSLPNKATTEAHKYWLEVVRENGERELISINMPAQKQNKICVKGTKEISLFCVEYK